jgi:hypothetical protein
MRRLTALLVAFFVAKPLGAIVGERCFEKTISSKLAELLASSKGEELSSLSPDALADRLPTLLGGVLQLFGVDVDGIASSAQASGESLAEAFASRIASPAANILGAVVVFVCAYFLVRILLRFIVSIVNAVFCLPGLRILNKTLGALFGLLFAMIAAWLFVTLLAFVFEMLTGNGSAFFAEFDIEKTYLAKYFCHLKPLELLLSI